MSPEDRRGASADGRGPEGQGSPSHRRRARYPGAHPRRFDQRYKERDPQAYPQMQEHVKAQGRTPAGTHVPVLMREVPSWLRPAPGEIVADCTVGYGGHAMEFLRRIGPTGRLIGFDVDGQELERTRKRLTAFVENLCGGTDFGEPSRAGAPPRDRGGPTGPARLEQAGDIPPHLPFSLYRRNFAGIADVLAEEGVDGYDIIFADLGVSSMQVDDPSRGFSYKHKDAPLDMRMDDRLQRTAADVLASVGEEELSAALWELSDEPDRWKIAQWIVRQRQVAPIARTDQLVRLIFHAKGTTEKLWRKLAEYKDLHPAARTFQALRIMVNDELGALKQLLRIAPAILRPGGRIGIISFHSGEDRLVKNSFRDGLRAGVYSAISEHVIRPSAREVHTNPRSSSAKFRWARIR